jgi:hypothetical protein
MPEVLFERSFLKFACKFLDGNKLMAQLKKGWDCPFISPPLISILTMEFRTVD